MSRSDEIRAVIGEAKRAQAKVLEAVDAFEDLDGAFAFEDGGPRFGALVRSAFKVARRADERLLTALTETQRVVAALEGALEAELERSRTA